MKEKILRTYMGQISGSMGGREDGYPERKYSSHTTLKKAAAVDWGDYPSGVEYFKLVPIPKEDIADARKAAEQAVHQEEVADVDREIQSLQSKQKRLKGESS